MCSGGNQRSVSRKSITAARSAALRTLPSVICVPGAKACGAAIGWWGRNRFWRGELLGALLGPVGWWLLWRTRGAFAECGSCSRPVRVQARTCPHCGAGRDQASGRSSRSQLKGVERGRAPW